MWRIAAAAAALSCVVAVPVNAQDLSEMSTEQKLHELYQISYELHLIDAARASGAEKAIERAAERAAEGEDVSWGSVLGDAMSLLGLNAAETSEEITPRIRRAAALVGSLDFSALGVTVDSFSLSVGFASITLRVTQGNDK